MKNETIKTIMKWHEEAFPDATLDGQINKFFDEQEEFHSAKTASDKVVELADMFIVACGIGRFCQQDFICDLAMIYDLMFEHNISYVKLEIAVNKKMAINRQRKWDKGVGNYQHKED